ncbi:MAG: FMN-binding protein [Phycisphaerae bacterium]|nr:FMN-binding protein [Phycisphaerae bacterium]
MAESWLVLVLGVVFACLLAGTQTQLSAKIQANQAKALENAIAEVVPGFDEKEQLEIDGNRVFKCVDGSGQVVGWAVDATGSGFIDKIRLVVGLSPDGATITGLKVIEDLETPGLGNKIEGEWADQYETLDATRPIVRVKGERHAADNEISAITGATYSSDYVTDIVNDVTRRIGPKLAEQQ